MQWVSWLLKIPGLLLSPLVRFASFLGGSFGKLGSLVPSAGIFSALSGVGGMIPLKWAVYAMIALAPFASYGWAAVKFRMEMRQQVQIARMEEIGKCNVRVAEIEKAHNDVVAEGIADANAAAEQIEPTPETPQEIVELCKRSASCRKEDLE